MQLIELQKPPYTRAITCLRRARYTTLEEVALLTYDDMIKIRNLGDAYIHRISELRVNYGYEPITFPEKKGIDWSEEHKKNHKEGVCRANARRMSRRSNS